MVVLQYFVAFYSCSSWIGFPEEPLSFSNVDFQNKLLFGCLADCVDLTIEKIKVRSFSAWNVASFLPFQLTNAVYTTLN